MGADKLIKTLEGHTDGVLTLAFSPDGALLASGGEDNAVRLWSVPGGGCLRTIQAHEGDVRSVAFFPDGAALASAGWDKAVKLWRAADGAQLRAINAHGAAVNRVAVSGDGAVLLSAADDQAVKLWRVKDGSLLSELRPELGDVKALALSPAGAVIAAGGTELKFLDFSDGSLLKVNSDYVYGVRDLAFSRDGARLAAALGMEKKLELWKAAGGEIALEGALADPDWLNCAAFSPDGKYLYTGGSAVKKWDLASGKAVDAFAGHADEIYAVAVSPDGKLVASASNDRTIKLWNAG